MKTSINGVGILLDDCSLKLIGTPRPGQCNLLPDPSTGAPSPCGALTIMGSGWINTTNVRVSVKKALYNGCLIRCQRQGIIPPFKPTFKFINVNDEVKNINVDIITFHNNQDHLVNFNVSIIDTSDENESLDGAIEYSVKMENTSVQEAVNFEEKEKYAVCNYRNCKQASQCQYMQTSHKPRETNESKNANILKENLGRESFDLYAKECGEIATTLLGSETYSIAHHHIIPVNQCFKQYPEIVKLANYFNYDINNALNGICLPTMNQGYDKQPLDLRLEIAFLAMEKLGKQWHKGGHSYRLDSIEKISKEVDNLLILKSIKSYKSYKASVDEYLEQFRNKIVSEGKCFAKNYDVEAKLFCDTMNHICLKIANKLRKFETDPKESHSFFVSKIAFYYAYYDVLKDYQDIIFGGENSE